MKFFTAKNHQYEINVWQNSNSFRFMTEKKIRYDHIDDDHILMDLTFDSSLGLFFYDYYSETWLFPPYHLAKEPRYFFTTTKCLFSKKKHILKTCQFLMVDNLSFSFSSGDACLFYNNNHCYFWANIFG